MDINLCIKIDKGRDRKDDKVLSTQTFFKNMVYLGRKAMLLSYLKALDHWSDSGLEKETTTTIITVPTTFQCPL